MDLPTYIFKSLTYIRNYINNSFSTLEAWEIILYSVVTTLLMLYVKIWIDDLRGKNIMNHLFILLVCKKGTVYFTIVSLSFVYSLNNI